MENAEIQSIKQFLGLQHGKEYDSTKGLRYGHLMIMTDQDHDGSHIKGLLINFIHSFWPSLLKIPSFMVEFITPIVKVTNNKNKTVLSFYSMPEYEAWKESLGGNASGWSIKYYKGLGTSTSKEGKEYFQDIGKHKKDFTWEDDQDGDAIELAFSKKKIEARKNWLRQFEPGTYLDQSEKLIKYSNFVNKELILFSMADLQRSIPSMVDGLKPGQRKILFCSFKRNFVKEAKVAQFSGYVSEHSAYHHGEQSLASTIIGMAQDFVGSNNINLLQPKGQFGTRHQGGKDHASARYMPIIPMVLVNGSEGIGTAWSTFVPNYNPRDIVANVRRLLNDEQMQPMDPWYRGFKGLIEKSATKEAGVTYTIVGLIEEVDSTTLRITELPIRRWTQDYKEFLESMMTGNDKIKEPFIKKALLDNLELDLLKLDNKVRFILGVVRGEIIVNNWKREDLFLELQQKGFTPFPKKSKGIDAAIAGAMVEEDGNEESPEVVKDGAKAADYEYLLSMAIGNLTWEKVQELCADRKKLEDEVKELKKSTPKDLWMKDLDALEKELDEQDRKDAEDGMKRETRTKSTTTAAVSRQGPKKPRKNNANNSSTASDVTSADAGNAPEAFKPEPRGHTKKAPAKKVTVVESDEDEEVLSLKDRLASYNLDSSPYQSAMETGAVLSQEEQRKKEPSRRKASRKASSTFTDISDGDDADDDMPTILEDDEQDFELVEAPKGRKQRGKKPANEKAKGGKVGTTATRKRRSTQGKPAPSQKLITEVQKPVENVGISPEKKVRKTSASPLNKKSGSVLGRIGSSPTGSEESGSSSTRIPAELNEVPVAAARPKRENRTRAVYIESDSETDEPAIDGSDFDLEED